MAKITILRRNSKLQGWGKGGSARSAPAHGGFLSHSRGREGVLPFAYIRGKILQKCSGTIFAHLFDSWMARIECNPSSVPR